MYNLVSWSTRICVYYAYRGDEAKEGLGEKGPPRPRDRAPTMHNGGADDNNHYTPYSVYCNSFSCNGRHSDRRLLLIPVEI